MRYILIGRGKMGRLLQETARAAGDQVEAAFGREDLDQLGRLGKVADVVIDFAVPERRCSPAPRATRRISSGSCRRWEAPPRCCGAPISLWVLRYLPGHCGMSPGC